VVGLDLSERTGEFLEMQELSEKEPPYMYISFKRVKLHIYMFQEGSEFYPFRDLLMVIHEDRLKNVDLIFNPI